MWPTEAHWAPVKMPALGPHATLRIKTSGDGGQECLLNPGNLCSRHRKTNPVNNACNSLNPGASHFLNWASSAKTLV